MEALSPSHEKLGQRIKELRSKIGLTQEKLADLIDIDRSYMGFIERGERNPTFDKLLKIAKSLKVSLPELFDSI